MLDDSERGDAAHKTDGGHCYGIFGGVYSSGGFVMMGSLETEKDDESLALGDVPRCVRRDM